MAINWRLRSTVFQLLVAVYAELGEEAFKGRFASIAQYFGPDASYDAIKSFFSKEISKAALQLKAQVPNHRGSGRVVPTRSSAGPSRRPPHLCFDDEDVSILTQREIEAVEARVGHSLRAPARRPRVIKASPGRSPEPEVIFVAPTINELSDESQPAQTIRSEQEPVRANHTAAAQSLRTVQSDIYYTVPEDSGPSRKRPCSEVRQTTESEATPHVRPSAPPHTESFGYVTNHGQYRCALCLSQLPCQEDLTRHEQVSKEHLRNLQLAAKVAKGREKLAQVITIPEPGRHHNTPVPLPPLRIHKYQQSTEPQDADPSTLINQAAITVHDTPSETVEVRRRSLTPTPAQSISPTPAPHPEPRITLDKGKGRAESIVSTVPPVQPLRQLDSSQFRTPSHPPSMPASRPTTACTEIGTLYSPHTVRSAIMAPPYQPQDPQTQGSGSASTFSATEMADIIRSTELIVQLMSCVQREAKAVAGAKSNSEDASFDSGISLGNSAAAENGKERGATDLNKASASESETMQGSSSSSRVDREITDDQARLRAPGIEVYHGMKRKRVDMNDRTNGKRRDAGNEVSFIVLE